MIFNVSKFAAVALAAMLVAGCAAVGATGDMVKGAGIAIGKGVGAVAGATTGWGSNGDANTESQGSSRIALNSDDPDLDELGLLVYRGGLKLKSKDERFGGLSGLIVTDDGKTFLAVSDAGYWVSGKLLYRKGDLVGAREITVHPMLGLNGEEIVGKKKGDAESLIGMVGGGVLVSFERDHRIWAYDLSRGDFNAVPQVVVMPETLKMAQSNGGLEGITQLKGKSAGLLALTENTKDDAGNLTGWLVRPGNTSTLSLRTLEPFRLTDLATLPGGDVLTLERRYSPVTGVGYQIRRIDGASIEPGAILDGPILAKGANPFAVDNMEGLAVRSNSRGDLIVYIVSDDNFNPLQRTLLLSFKLRN
jgi:hypothetical protein